MLSKSNMILIIQDFQINTNTISHAALTQTFTMDVQRYAEQIVQSAVELFLTLRNTFMHNNPLLMSVWSEEEIADLVDYLFHCRVEISEGSFPLGTFYDLAVYLNRRYPGSERSHKSVLSKFGAVRTSISNPQPAVDSHKHFAA